MWTAALVFGLLSSLHCVGMCGPIALLLPVDRNSTLRKAGQITVYHFGRIAVYATIGLLFGLLGKTLYLAGLQQRLSIIAGSIMLLAAILPEKTLLRYALLRPLYDLTSKWRGQSIGVYKKRSLSAFFAMGLFNGALPCGLVYTALFGAMAMPSVWEGGMFMIVFGLGNMTVLASLAYFNPLMGSSFRKRFQKLVPIAVGIMGVLFIIRGLGLAIPYMSPDTLSLNVMQGPACH